MTQFTARHRSQLEALWQQPVAQRQAFSEPSIADAIRQFGKDVLAFLTGTQQLRIWTKATKQGVVWFAYDPISGKNIRYASEEKLRIWLENIHQS
ncbi:MAG: hypothetical protein AAFN12_14905 [Cyanobacteria bacterium J06560_2]